MAFPGRPEDKYSAGCNFLIKENIAALTENATDVAHLLGYPIKNDTATNDLTEFQRRRTRE